MTLGVNRKIDIDATEIAAVNWFRRLFGQRVTETGNVGWQGVQFYPMRTTAGETVTESTALTLPAYFAAIRVLSEDIAKIPRRIIQKANGKTTEHNDHPVSVLLNRRPNEYMTPFVFISTLTQWRAAWGKGCAEIVRDNRGEPKALYPIHPSRIQVMYEEGRGKYFRVFNDTGMYSEISDANMFHYRGFGDGLDGYSLIQFAAESIGESLALRSFGSSFFRNQAMPGVVLMHPGELEESQINQVRRQWSEMFSGGNAFRTAVLQQGMTLEKMTIPNQDAQFIESRKMSVETFCMLTRVNPNKIQYWEKSSYNTIEAANIDHVNDTLMPGIVTFEEEAQAKLLGIESPLQLKFNVRGLLRGNLASQSQFLREMLTLGIYTPNMVLEYLDEDTFDGGDERYFPANMATLDDVTEGNVGTKTEPGDRPGDDMTPPQPGQGNGQKKKAIDHLTLFAKTITSAATPVVRKEQSAIKRAQTKHTTSETFNDWAIKFYVTDIRQNLIEAVQTPAIALAQILVDGAIDPAKIETMAAETVNVFADHYIDRARVRMAVDGSEKYLAENHAVVIGENLSRHIAVAVRLALEKQEQAA